MNKILDRTLTDNEIKHSCKKIQPIRFKDEAINKVKSTNYKKNYSKTFIRAYSDIMIRIDIHNKYFKLQI